MTKSDAWKKRPSVMRYWAFKDECRLRKVSLPVEGATVTFVLPMPDSWSDEKRATMNGKPHQQTPDLDNLLKSLQDAIYDDDRHIHDIRIKKVWGYRGGIKIET
jgi:Holliday junction resolvase RusA-like endonuclease